MMKIINEKEIALTTEKILAEKDKAVAERVVYKFSVKAEFRNKNDVVYPRFDEIKGALAVSGDIDRAAHMLIRAFNFRTPKDEEYLVIRDIKLKYVGPLDDILNMNSRDGVLYYERRSWDKRKKSKNRV